MAEKINRSVVTSSFSEDNYARRMLERTMDAVDNNADILSDIEQIVEPFPLWGTYVQASGTYPPRSQVRHMQFRHLISQLNRVCLQLLQAQRLL